MHQQRSLKTAARLLFLACMLSGVTLAEETTEPTSPLLPTLGLPFRDNAVLQQQIPLAVWGSTQPGAAVTVSFAGQSKQTTAGTDGTWRVVLDPMRATQMKSVNASPPVQTMRVTCQRDGESVIREIRGLLVGEVWLCAGQSNMAGKMRTNKSRHHPPDSIERATYPALRQLVSPQDGPWTVCSPETAPEFKKVCFFFARKVHKEIRVPVGVINAAVGGSRIEPWLDSDPFERGKHFSSMIEPLAGFGLRGVLWYQGESNAKDGRAYLPKLRALILGWRKAWGQAESKTPGGPQADFPVYYVQLPGIGTSTRENPAGGDGRAEIRQAYVDALALKNTGMAVTIDIGAVREHPPNKYDTGVRLANLALHHDYGRGQLVPTGPLYKEHVVEGDSIRVRFQHAENGLMLAKKEGFLPPEPTPKAELNWLSLQGKDGTWHWAEHRIDGSDLIVFAPGVKVPTAVRYGYTNHPTGSLLYNTDGLPASPFSTSGYDKEPAAPQQ